MEKSFYITTHVYQKCIVGRLNSKSLSKMLKIYISEKNMQSIYWNGFVFIADAFPD